MIIYVENQNNLGIIRPDSKLKKWNQLSKWMGHKNLLEAWLYIVSYESHKDYVFLCLYKVKTYCFSVSHHVSLLDINKIFSNTRFESQQPAMIFLR